MPSTSRKQQRLFGMALAYKRGARTDVSESVKELANSMSEEQLRHFTVYDPTYAKRKREKE